MRQRRWVRSVRPAALAVVAALMAATGVSGVAGAMPRPAQTPACPWMDASKSPDARANMLLRAMSLDDKISMLYGRGDLTYYGAANVVPANPARCVPALVFNDAGAGVGDGQVNATAFPDGIAQAASWDVHAQRAYGAALGGEAWQKGINVQLAPGVNIARVPMNGRNFEYAGEDPYLAGQTASAVVQGIQSQHVVATVKHLALNNQETNRMTSSSDVDERTMQELYLPAFETAVTQGKVGSAMCSYNRINSVYACENPTLLTSDLKQQFGFNGWVMSDWAATHSTVAAANAGLDQEQNIGPGTYFSAPLKAAVHAGQVPMSRLNDMVLRILRSMFRIGLFDHPVPPEPQGYATVTQTPAELAVARNVAEQGMVLLKNGGGVLPISGGGKRIAVIGFPAGPAGANMYYQGGGSSHVPLAGTVPGVVSPLAGITRRGVANGDVVTYADGSATADAVAAAKAADIAVVFAGTSDTEGIDRSNLLLNSQYCTLFGCTPPTTDPNQMIAAVAATNPNTVVVLNTGGPVLMPWLDAVKGVVEAWYPGQEDGNATAAVLFGDVNPSGKLPFTFPKSQADTPIQTAAQWPGVNDHSTYSEQLLVGYRWYDQKNITPLFPFGFGLSYTTFSYSGLTVTPGASGATVSFAVTNTGDRTGADVAQLYVADPASAGEPPKQLKGFAKVQLAPGQTKRVTLSLDQRAFSYWNTAGHSWLVAPGCYGLLVGDSSQNLPLQSKLARAGGACP